MRRRGTWPLAVASVVSSRMPWLRLRTVRVAGDRERERQAEREAQDKIISKGSRVVDFAFGPGVIVGVFLKSYRVQFDRGYTHARDKTYVRLEVR